MCHADHDPPRNLHTTPLNSTCKYKAGPLMEELVHSGPTGIYSWQPETAEESLVSWQGPQGKPFAATIGCGSPAAGLPGRRPSTGPLGEWRCRFTLPDGERAAVVIGEPLDWWEPETTVIPPTNGPHHDALAKSEKCE
jgi:hypothetical protein